MYISNIYININLSLSLFIYIYYIYIDIRLCQAQRFFQHHALVGSLPRGAAGGRADGALGEDYHRLGWKWMKKMGKPWENHGTYDL